jgi:thiamine-phosphate pyrophosphorylase
VFKFLRNLLPRAAEPAEPNLVLITRPEPDIAGERRAIKRLFHAGLGRLHLRKPDWSAEDHQRFLDDIPQAYWPRIVLYTHADIVLSRGLGGLHLKAGERLPRSWPEGRPISTSCHSYEELRDGPRRRAYSVLGPLFSSVSKRDHAPRRTPRELEVILQRWRSEGGCPVYALGGISPENAARARDHGFDGLAFVGCVWDAQDPSSVFLDLERAWLGQASRRRGAR